MTLAGQLSALWSRERDTNGLWHAGIWWTWGELCDLADEVMEAVGTAGSRDSEPLAVAVRNLPEAVAVILGALSQERAVSFVNGLQPPERLVRDVTSVGPEVFVAPYLVWEKLDEAAVAPPAKVRLAVGPGRKVQVLEAGDQVTGDVDRAPVGCIELFTSGTTGPAKRIRLTLDQLESSLGSALRHNVKAAAERPTPRSPALVSGPLSHIGGMFGVMQALAEARPVILLDRFEVEPWVEAVRTFRPRITGVPPTGLQMILDAGVPREALKSLRAINAGTAPLSPDLVDRFYERYGIPILNVYGATEFAGSVAGWSRPMFKEWWVRKRGSIGRPQPGVEVRIVDDAGNELPRGEQGLLELKTRQLGTDSWIRTADLARWDEDDFLWVDGRADDVIIRGGFKVDPKAVKAVLEEHPAVVEAAIGAKPDRRLGAVPVAAVELRPGAEVPSGDELIALCRSHLMPYEVPAEIRVVDALPRSASMKVSAEGVLQLFAETAEVS